MRKGRGGRPVVCGADAQGRFLAAVRRGASLAAAARAGGCALTTFYNRRRVEPGFAAAWDEAVDESLIEPGSGAAGGGGAGRRLRLRGARRETFLAALSTDCNTADAALAAGVHRSTVYRRIRRDAGFARACAAALARGYVGLERALARAQAWNAARFLSAVDTGPTAPPPADFDTQMRILARYSRPAKPRRGRRPRRGAGR
ncbi:MAG TPA: hypothetical protein VGD66_03675 [Allosphingosinicella sp.]